MTEVRSRADLLAVDYRYRYPNRMNLRPGSELHEKIKNDLILEPARASKRVMSHKHGEWERIEHSLNAFVWLDEDEAKIKADDERKPVRIVVPTTFAMRETIMTYLMATFLDGPFFRYSGVGPEDAIPAILLEKVIDLQFQKGKAALALWQHWSDCLTYGFSPIAVEWVRRYGKRPVRRPSITFDENGRLVETGEMETSVEDALLFEGNVFRAIDPYLYFPDTNVGSLDRVQEGEYVEWLTRDNRMSLLSAEGEADSLFFNCKYLKHIDGKSALFMESSDTGRASGETRVTDRDVSHPIDILCAYRTLVPEEVGLPGGDRPEKWLFALAGDEVVIAAHPMELNHNLYPIVVAAPHFEGRSVMPLSRLEVVQGMQETIDFLMNSHIANVRKAVNDRFVFNPRFINVYDLKEPLAGGFIRLRPEAYGRDIDQCIKQLKIDDITRSNVADAGVMLNLIRQVGGTPEGLQGIMREGPERVTKDEARSVRQSGLARLQALAMIISLQSHQDLGEMVASHTQQLLSRETYVDITGDWESTLRQEYGITSSRLPVSPMDLAINFDVLPMDRLRVGADSPEVWNQLLQTAAQIPEILQKTDMHRVFLHVARLAGAKNVEQFQRRMNNMQTQIMPDEQVAAMAAAGNIAPLGALG